MAPDIGKTSVAPARMDNPSVENRRRAKIYVGLQASVLSLTIA
jgi:hypothetical protein